MLSTLFKGTISTMYLSLTCQLKTVPQTLFKYIDNLASAALRLGVALQSRRSGVWFLYP